MLSRSVNPEELARSLSVGLPISNTFSHEVYQVVAVHGEGAEAKAYTLRSSQGQRENLGFVQRVSVERLTPVDLLPLSAPGDDVKIRDSVERERGILTSKVHS